MDEKQISNNIRKLRLERGLSLEQIARLAGPPKGYVSKIENSEKARPFSTLIKVAEALTVDTNVIMAEETEIPEDARLCIVGRAAQRQESIGPEPAEVLAIMYYYKRRA